MIQQIRDKPRQAMSKWKEFYWKYMEPWDEDLEAPGFGGTFVLYILCVVLFVIVCKFALG